MPNSLEALLILFFVAPGFVAVETLGQLRPMRERSTLDKLITTIVVSLGVHLFALPAWLLANDLGDFFVLPPEPPFVLADDGSLWMVWMLGMSYLLPASIAGFLVGKFLLPTVLQPKLPVWTKELYAPAKETGNAVSAFVTMTNGDIYSGLIRSIPHDYDTLHGDDKDFSLEKAEYLAAEAPSAKSLDGQIVLLNTSDVVAIHTLQTPPDEPEVTTPAAP